MKRISLLLAAALSVFAAWGATRPHFGGTLTVAMRGSLASFNLSPGAGSDDDLLRDAVLSCVCDRLITLDAGGDPRPALATAWRSEHDSRSWTFTLRAGVAMPSGTLSGQAVVASLATSHPNWRVRADGQEITIESDTPEEDMPFELAKPRSSICLSGDGGRWVGSGPFQISQFQPGQYIELKAFEQAWEGRPFLDAIRFNMHSPADQNAGTFSRADLVQIQVPEIGSIGQSQATEPIELVALLFAPNRSATSDVRLRKAIALSVDRNSIVNVLLRHTGEADAALLPEWISGYAHLFDTAQNLLEAKRLAALTSAPQLSIGYDNPDPIARLIAERVVVNAGEARVRMQAVAQTTSQYGNTDVELVRLRIESPHPGAALMSMAAALHLPLERADESTSAEYLYGLESAALKDYTVVPIAVVPEKFSASRRLHDWFVSRWGEINWGNIWMESSP